MARKRVSLRGHAPDRAAATAEVAAPDAEGVDLEAAGIRSAGERARALYFQYCRTDVNAFVEHVIRDEKGDPVRQEPFHVRLQHAVDRHGARGVVVRSHPESGKRLSVDTEIPVVGGWKRMGAVRVGDVVFGRDGAPCSVTAVSRIEMGRMFRVRFDDGSWLDADGDHLWTATYCGGSERVVSTDEMLRRGLRTSDLKWKWHVPVCGPVMDAGPALVLPPYVLGVWLGDGNSRDSRITFHEKDRFIWDRCVQFVGGREARSYSWRPGIMNGTLGASWGEVRAVLRELEVLWPNEKHIPPEYLHASVSDRFELLAGLLDTDGSVSNGPSGGSSRVEYCSCSPRLARDFLQLARGLGLKASMKESDAVIDGRVVGRRWRVTFTARVPVFKLPRKLERQRLGDASRVGGRHRFKSVVGIDEIPSCPAKCITVDSPDHTYLAGRAYTVTHNSTQIVGRILFDLGNAPWKRFVALGNEMEGAKKTVRVVKKYVEESAALHEVFPDLVPGPVWQENRITVRRTVYSRDPSLQAVGYHGAVQGSRCDGLFADDFLDFENTQTEVQRSAASSWFRQTPLRRMTDGAVKVFATNPWHPRALDVELVKRGWHELNRPIRDPDGSIHTKQWNEARLATARAEMTVEEFLRFFELVATDQANRTFQPQWYDACRRHDVALIKRLDEIPEGCVVVTGVDLGGKRRTNGKSAIFVLLVHPSGKRQPLHVSAGNWRGPDLIFRIMTAAACFGGIIAVESNGIQQHLVDLASENSLTLAPIVPFNTGKNKTDPRFGLATLAAELETGRWVIPAAPTADPALEEAYEALRLWEAEGIDYMPDQHSGDVLMASWIAREVARRLHARVHGIATGGGVSVSTIG